VPSPVKLQPKVSYCKTYEQIRLEEIQAESAAYYSYENSNFAPYRNQEDVGKPKTINANHGNRWICINRSTDTQENATKMDFKVLTLEEIRQRKQEKELAVKAQPMLTTASQSSVSVAPIAIKRRSNEIIIDNSTDATKKCKIAPAELAKNTDFTVIKGPVKLRRKTLKVAARKSETQSCESTPVNETANSSQNDEKACRERLESHSDKLTNVNRRGEVEVRMCDSSTTEQKTQTQPERETEDKKSVATYATTEDIVNSVLLNQPFINEEYLNLDASSDDIMKDIEDLLK